MRETKDILTAWKNTRILKKMGTEYPSKSAGIEGAVRDLDNLNKDVLDSFEYKFLFASYR